MYYLTCETQCKYAICNMQSAICNIDAKTPILKYFKKACCGVREVCERTRPQKKSLKYKYVYIILKNRKEREREKERKKAKSSKNNQKLSSKRLQSGLAWFRGSRQATEPRYKPGGRAPIGREGRAAHSSIGHGGRGKVSAPGFLGITMSCLSCWISLLVH